MHLLFLLVFLVTKWTNLTSIFEEVGVYPISRIWTDLFVRRELNQYKCLLIMFTSNLIGMMFSRGTHQQFYSWYSYSFPFLADAAFGD